MRLDIRHFVTLAYVARFRSFTEAAEHLGYTQSAVSQQVRRLEALIGDRLVERAAGGKDVALTPAGRIMLEHAQTLTATMERVAVDIEALHRGAAGILRIGCFESVGAALLPRVLAEFRQRLPKVHVVPTELPDDGDLLTLLESGDLDLTFVVFPLPEGPFVTEPLLDDPYVLVVSKDSPLASSDDPVDLEHHPDLPLMSYADLRAPHRIEARLGRPGFGSRVVFRSNHNATLINLAAHNYAAAIVAQLAFDTPRDDIHVRPLAGVNPRVIGLAWRDRGEVPLASRTFVEVARNVCARRPERP